MSRELLEKAAKAAGIEVTEQRGDSLPWTVRVNGKSYPWNPLTDDGDAGRLAAKLRISVLWQHDWVMAYAGDVSAREYEPSSAAMRRAIVRAAAAMEGA